MVSTWGQYGEAMMRGERMSILALSTPVDLERLWSDIHEKPSFDWIRPPEFGAVMARGRICGDGGSFNLGEIATTRCILQLRASHEIGVACVIGRRRRHATLAALLDAITQSEGATAEFARKRIVALKTAVERRREEVRAAIAKSEVDFSMLLRTVTP
jgi:alpha-D-ribose 1-methylphosphonate 5-triphosphate synthase subunit PhnG